MTDDTKLIRNPTGKGGFGDHPENRSDGGWKKENSIGYQYRRFLNMTQLELEMFEATPKSDKTQAEILAYKAVIRAKESLPDIKEVTDRTEGKAPQFIGLGTADDYTTIALVEFMDSEDGDGTDAKGQSPDSD